jgi:membrane protein implicated in regulation of membrane protease activity
MFWGSAHHQQQHFIYQSSRDSHTSHFHTPSTSVKMQYSILALASAASYVSAQSLSTPSASASAIGAVVPVGEACTPGGTMCALGSGCYAVNSMLQTVCGNFQAQCTSDQQCAFNTCSGGFCSGFLSSSSSASATVTSTPSASASPIGAVVPVGEACTPGGTMCALGSGCYAVNSMLQTVCGNFQAQCTSDQQCAFNTCNEGFCNGFLSSSSSASATVTSTSAGGYTPAPSSTVTAPAGSLPLGAECNALVNPSQCTAGVQCWASNAGLIASCGNFNAACSSDAQCAYNTCNNGLCSGPLSSGAGNATSTVRPTGSLRPSGSAAATTTSAAQFTGAASVANVANGLAAVVLGAVALVL